MNITKLYFFIMSINFNFLVVIIFIHIIAYIPCQSTNASTMLRIITYLNFGENPIAFTTPVCYTHFPKRRIAYGDN